MAMELPDEAIAFDYQGAVAPALEEWGPVAEMRARHFVAAQRLKDFLPRLLQARGQVTAEREMRHVPLELQPLEPGFIDLPQQHLDAFRRKGEASELGRCIAAGQRLRDDADTVVFLGAGGSHFGPRALFEALKPAHHNELPATQRPGVPRAYFDGCHADSDALQDLLDLLQLTCIDPENREERWAVVAISKSGSSLEPAVALRQFRREAAEYYGLRSPWQKKLFLAVTGTTSRVRDLFKAAGHPDDDVFAIPDNVGGRFSIFTPAGLLPAAVLGLDVRAMLLGAAAMTKRFLDEPFERNPVLQLAAVNFLLTEECGKPLRALALWSRKLEAVGRWYEQLVGESLAKQGRGPTPLTLVGPRDLYARGQQLQDGPRDRVVHNVVIAAPRGTPLTVQMADRNEDDLNQYNRKSLPEIARAAHAGATRAYHDAARPTTDLVLPSLTEHTLGQLLQLLMLATVVEARLMGVNPYSAPGVEAARRHQRDVLKQAKPAVTIATEDEEAE